LTACGSAASEDTERPKTPFELESEIQSLQADDEAIKGDTAWLRSAIVTLQGTAAKDWTADINSIISRLSAIEAKLNAVSTPTPTATSQGGWPVPTATATQISGQLIYLNPSDKFFKTYTAELILTAGSVDITNPIINIRFESATQVPSPSISLFNTFIGGASYPGVSSVYSSTSKTVLMYKVTTSGVFIPSGSTVTGTVNFSCTDSVFWTPSASKE
jgi:hypothetical protein